MINYDFVVTHHQKLEGKYAYKLTVEKVAVLDDDVTLDKWLPKEDVDNRTIGETIERLESIPYGAKTVEVQGRNGLILIEQV